MASRYTQYNQANPQSMFVPQNLDLTYKALENKQHIQDVNEETGNALKDYILKTPGLTEEDKRANQVKAQEVDKAMDDIHSKYQGDLTQATSDIKNLVRKYKYDPELQARTSNYNAAINHFEDIQKSAKDSNHSSQDLAAYHNQIINGYGATRKQQDGSYNQIQLPGLGKHINEGQKIRESLEKVKDSDLSNLGFSNKYIDDYHKGLLTTEQKGTLAQKLYDYGISIAKNDSDIQESLGSKHSLYNNIDHYKRLDDEIRGTAIGLAHNTSDNKLHIITDDLGLLNAKKKQPEEPIPVYEVPGQSTVKVEPDFGKFEIQKSHFEPSKGGSAISSSGIGVPSYKADTKEITPPKQLPDRERKVFEGFIKSFYPSMYSKYEKGEKVDWKPFYDTLKNNKDNILKAASVTNNQVRGIDKSEEEEINRHFKDGTAADLGTGMFSSAKYFDTKNQKELTYDEFLNSIPEENRKDKLQITSKLHRNNGLGIITGNDNYTDGNVISVGGNTYIQSAPKYYEGQEANNKLQVNRAVNKVNNAKYSPINGGITEIDLNNIGLGTVPIRTVSNTLQDGSEEVTYYIGKDTKHPLESPEEVVTLLTQLNNKK